jgi:hypothetical protein
MADLALNRHADDGHATRGELHLAPFPSYQCWTLERAWKNNDPGELADLIKDVLFRIAGRGVRRPPAGRDGGGDG